MQRVALAVSIKKPSGHRRMELMFVLLGIVAVWQFAGLVRDLWYTLRERKDEPE